MTISNTNLNCTFAVRWKAAKRSETWFLAPPLPQNTLVPLPPSPQGEDIPARKKPRLDEYLPTTTDEAARKTSAPNVPAGIPPPAADYDDANVGYVTDTQANVGATGITGLGTRRRCKAENSSHEHMQEEAWEEAHDRSGCICRARSG